MPPERSPCRQERTRFGRLRKGSPASLRMRRRGWSRPRGPSTTCMARLHRASCASRYRASVASSARCCLAAQVDRWSGRGKIRILCASGHSRMNARNGRSTTTHRGASRPSGARVRDARVHADRNIPRGGCDNEERRRARRASRAATAWPETKSPPDRAGARPAPWLTHCSRHAADARCAPTILARLDAVSHSKASSCPPTSMGITRHLKHARIVGASNSNSEPRSMAGVEVAPVEFVADSMRAAPCVRRVDLEN